jgi:drug/metabolite transporter (DMT)-like permease
LLAHVAAAGLLMHAVNLGGSHYAQYLGMSAGITALILALQPLVTATIAAPLLHERLRGAQWLGVALGLVGVAFVVWHKIDLRAITWPALAAVTIALGGITAGTLYQRIFCPAVDLRAASVVQFIATLIVLVPLAVAVEGFVVRWSWPLAASIVFLVVLASILAVNALHTLMRRGQATRVTSLLYLTPIIAVALEWAMFGTRPTLLTLLGIAVTCAGVALVAWQPRATETRA